MKKKLSMIFSIVMFVSLLSPSGQAAGVHATHNNAVYGQATLTFNEGAYGQAAQNQATQNQALNSIPSIINNLNADSLESGNLESGNLGIDNLVVPEKAVSTLLKDSEESTGAKETTNPFNNINYFKEEKKEINNIVVLIRFKGEEEFMTEEKSLLLDSTYNYFADEDNNAFSDLGSISLKSYINDLTYGKINVETSIYPRASENPIGPENPVNPENTTYISLEAPYTREYYENYYAGSSIEREFIAWAFNQVKDQVNLEAVDLDKDNNGEIDAITFIVNGVTTSQNMLWPHQTTFTGDANIKGKRLGSYNLINVGNQEVNIFNKKMLRVVIHEFLHVLNYPDLYRYYSYGSPVGEWDIMGNSVGYGQLPLVYTRNQYGNLNLNIKEITEDGVYTLKNSQSTNKDDTIAFKIKSPLSQDEYFMVEFRKQSGNWDSFLPGSGLIVYRINEAVEAWSGNRYGYPDHIYIFRPNETGKNQAGGYIYGAFLSKESGRTTIGTEEESTSFIPESLFFSNGQNSRIVISQIGSANGESISFKVIFPKEKKTIKPIGSTIGVNRFDTAAKISKKNITSSNTAILINGNSKVDGLTVSPIAGYLKAPILLVHKDKIPKETYDELIRLGVKNVIIAGGEGVVGKNIEKELTKIGVKNIQRLAGKNRYETSLRIAEYIDKNLYDVEKAVFGNGLAEADIISIAPISTREKMPIILTRKDNIDEGTYNWLAKEGIKNAYIIGGTGILSETLVNKLNKIVAADIKNNRLGGKDRYQTNGLIIEEFYQDGIDKLYLTKGLEIIDALSISSVAGMNNGAVLITQNKLSPKQEEILYKIKILEAEQIGGGISTNILNQIIEVLEYHI